MLRQQKFNIYFTLNNRGAYKKGQNSAWKQHQHNIIPLGDACTGNNKIQCGYAMHQVHLRAIYDANNDHLDMCEAHFHPIRERTNY